MGGGWLCGVVLGLLGKGVCGSVLEGGFLFGSGGLVVVEVSFC